MLSKILFSVFALFLLFGFVFAEESATKVNNDSVANFDNTTNVRPVAVVSNNTTSDSKNPVPVTNQIRERERVFDKQGSSEEVLAVLPVKAVVSERERLEERKRLLANATGLKLAQQVVDDSALRNSVAISSEDFTLLKAKIATAKAAEREKLKVELREKARNLVSTQLKANLEKLKVLSLDDETKKALVSLLEEKLKALESNDLDADDLAKISKEAKQNLERNMLRVKAKIGLQTLEKYSRFIDKAESYSALIGKKIEVLKAQGKDTSKVEEAKEKLDLDIVKIKDVMAKLKLEFSSAESKEDSVKIMQRAHLALRLAHFEVQKDFILIRLSLIALKEISEKGSISTGTSEQLNQIYNESENNKELGEVMSSLSEVEEPSTIEVVEGGEEQ
ncbi:MAG: hypothetical protein QXU92_03665 [Candidatus Diapherotrites archaeon]